VVEAIRWHDDGYTRTLAAVARQWDFRKDEVPPWPVMSQLGNNDVERNKYLKRLRRLAREAMEGAA
jgi:hypothetical protein